MALFLLAHLGLLNGTCLAVEQGIPHASRHLIGRRHGLPLFHSLAAAASDQQQQTCDVGYIFLLTMYSESSKPAQMRHSVRWELKHQIDLATGGAADASQRHALLRHLRCGVKGRQLLFARVRRPSHRFPRRARCRYLVIDALQLRRAWRNALLALAMPS